MFFCISTLSVSQRSTSSSASRSSASSFSSHHFYWCQPRANFVKTKCTNLTCYAMLTLPLNQFYAVHIFHISLFCQFVFLSSIFCFVVKRAVLGSGAPGHSCCEWSWLYDLHHLSTKAWALHHSHSLSHRNSMQQRPG